jgi:hypothetical protein
MNEITINEKMVSKKVYNGYKNNILKRISYIRKHIRENTGIFHKTMIFIHSGFSMSRPIVISNIGDSRVHHYSKRDDCYSIINGILVKTGSVNYK